MIIVRYIFKEDLALISNDAVVVLESWMSLAGPAGFSRLPKCIGPSRVSTLESPLKAVRRMPEQG